MEKIKKIISPHSKDEQPKYTDPDVGSPMGTTTAPTSASATTDSATTASAIRPQYLTAAADDNVSTQAIRSGVPGGDVSAPSHLESSTAEGSSTSERSFPLSGTDQSSHGRDAALVGGLSHEHAGHGHQYDPSAISTAPVQGYVHQFDGPHATDIANRLDPHVSNTGSSSVGAGVMATGSAAPLDSQERSRDIREPSAAGIAGYDDQKFDPALAHRHKESNHGAVVAGAATGITASSIGGYELAKDHQGGPDSTGPASKTVGPHSSNLANIVDPRVLPQPANQDGRTNETESRSEYRGAVAGGAAAGAGGAAVDSKMQEKLDKERAKEAEKAHERAVKDDHKGEKKHGVLGFLHRDKNDTADEKDLKEQHNYREADQLAHARHQRELEAAAETGAVPVAGASFEPPLSEQQLNPDASSSLETSTSEHAHHNKLHKDPPPKVQAELEAKSRQY